MDGYRIRRQGEVSDQRWYGTRCSIRREGKTASSIASLKKDYKKFHSAFGDQEIPINFAWS